ncbi:MAG TPA: AbgT family transporter [Acidobacteriota bacterium]|nr:AbgT family transporter [Acidobacteriota bacterium]
MPKNQTKPTEQPPSGLMSRFLDTVEVLGNKLPDPSVLFLLALIITWILSWLLAGVAFTEIDPRTGQPLQVQNQLTGPALSTFLANMVTTFTGFAPLGVVLLAMLGVGVAEHTGFITAGLKSMLSFTPGGLLTPMLILVAIVSHTAVDAGYVLVIPLGGVIFYVAGRHPLAGIAAAFAGVSGGFSANFIPSSIDVLLQGFTQSAAQIIDPVREVNPLCNWWFTAASSILVILLGWYLTDRVVEPRLRSVEVDGDQEEMPKMETSTAAERRGLWAGLLSMLIGIILLIVVSYPADSPLRDPQGNLGTFAAPLMQSIVPLIFLFFLIPGMVHGYIAGTVKSHRDIIKGMSKAMSSMAYYIVMAFFAAQFIAAFGSSNVGALISLKGASFLEALALPAPVTITGIIGLSAMVNLVVGSASAKWALIGPIFVPMLMQLGFSPELTQAAYRVGDSTTNIVTPLMPYFPLVVVYCQRYVKNTGIGTLLSMMLPFSVVLLVSWTIFLLLYWAAGIPLGIQGGYSYPP